MKSGIDASTQTHKQTAIVTCPDCGDKIVLTGLIHIGLGVGCKNCKAELKVVNMTPVEVDWVSQGPKNDKEFLARW
jgi:hypothetical protein